MKEQRIYAVRAHDRLVESDPSLGTIMYSLHGPEGPWCDLVTGDLEQVWELFEIIEAKEELNRLRELCELNNIDWRYGDDNA